MMCSVSSRSPSDIATRQAQARIPATTGLCLTLILTHLATGLWRVVQHGDPWFSALVLERGNGFRRAVGGQTWRLVESGEVWRLVSSVFLHVDLAHLVFNVLALWALGRMLEPLVGGWRWGTWVVIGGFSGSVASHLAGVPRSDGASGAAFALLGAAVVVGWRHRDAWVGWDRRLYGEVLWALVVVNLILGFWMPSVDGVAHVGGLGAGLILAGLYQVPQDRVFAGDRKEDTP